MSLENLKEYALRCANEPELRETVKTIGVADLDGQMRYAESLGLEWTMEDMAALRKEVAGSEDGLEDLSEEELEQVAGGAVSVTAVIAAVIAVGGVAVAGTVGAGASAGMSAAAAGGGW